MILSKPFQISARLLPTLKIGNGWLSYDRKTYVFYLDTPEFKYEIHDFRPSCYHGVQDCFKDMMAFFEYAIEEYTYNLRKNTKKTDEPLFPDHVTKWLVENENATFDIDYGLWTVPLIKD